MPVLTWRCHVCGDERPDEKISVHTRNAIVGDVPIRENVRYCNDRPECAEGARTHSFFPQAREEVEPELLTGIEEADREHDEWEFRWRGKRGLAIPRVLWRRMANWRRRGPRAGTK